MTTQEFIQTARINAEKQLAIAKRQLEMIECAPCIERCNSICVFPETGLTIDSDADGRPVVSNKILATQFAPKTAKMICEQVHNGKGQYPVIMSPVEYYRLQVSLIESSIDVLNKL